MSVNRVRVRASRPYDVCVGRGLLDELGALTREALPRAERALLVTDTNVAPLYAARAETSLAAAGFAVGCFTFEAGEARKRLATVESIYAALAAGVYGRGDVIVALGGGVAGDMAGFAAATWMRGMAFVQAPTTLLAQVDASVGGKTGVDTAAGKNLVGAFWQPSLVAADVDALATLPPAVFADGMAEVIKHACIRDGALFARLEAGGGDLEEVVARNVDIKRAIVEADEREAGARKLLNFGHTAGHALERHSGYALSHGSAVAIGMTLMARLGETLGVTAAGTAARLARVLERHGLPSRTDAPAAAWTAFMAADKKRQGASVDAVLLHGIGEGIVYPLPVAELIERVSALE